VAGVDIARPYVYCASMITLATMATRHVGTGELIDLLGVGRTRLSVLTNQPSFPSPAVSVRAGNIWELDQVIAWAQETGRTLQLTALREHVGQGDAPAIPVAAAELIDLFGVGRTQLSRIQARPDFPTPVISLKIGNIWNLADIIAWADITGRTLHLTATAPAAEPSER